MLPKETSFRNFCPGAGVCLRPLYPGNGVWRRLCRGKGRLPTFVPGHRTYGDVSARGRVRLPTFVRRTATMHRGKGRLPTFLPGQASFGEVCAGAKVVCRPLCRGKRRSATLTPGQWSYTEPCTGMNVLGGLSSRDNGLRRPFARGPEASGRQRDASATAAPTIRRDCYGRRVVRCQQRCTRLWAPARLCNAMADALRRLRSEAVLTDRAACYVCYLGTALPGRIITARASERTIGLSMFASRPSASHGTEA